MAEAEKAKLAVNALDGAKASLLLPLPVLYGERVGVRDNFQSSDSLEPPSPDVANASVDLSPHAGRGKESAPRSPYYPIQIFRQPVFHFRHARTCCRHLA